MHNQYLIQLIDDFWSIRSSKKHKKKHKVKGILNYSTKPKGSAARDKRNAIKRKNKR